MSITVTGEGRFVINDFSDSRTITATIDGSGIGGFSGAVNHSARVDLSVVQSGWSIASGAFDAALAAGPISQEIYLNARARYGDSGTLIAADIGQSKVGVLAAVASDGFTVLNLDGATPKVLGRVFDTENTHAAGITDTAMISNGSSAILATVSGREDGISFYTVTANGGVAHVTSAGMLDSLPVNTPTAVEAVRMGGKDYFVVASAGSSSLTVLDLAADGRLTVTDHVLDSRDTRFAGATELEVVTKGGHAFVVASGSDDGISVFRLTASGRLVHVATMEDTTAAALGNVSGLAAEWRADGLDIVTTSSVDAGLSHLRLDIGPLGEVIQQASGSLTGTDRADVLELTAGNGTIRGGDGDDILIDGPGSDRLAGGSGSDLFVMTRDGMRDVILGLRLGEDQIDLSLIGRLYDLSRISIEPTKTGGILTFRGEEVEIHTADGTSLTAADLARLIPTMTSHFDIALKPLEIASTPTASTPTPPRPPVYVRDEPESGEDGTDPGSVSRPRLDPIHVPAPPGLPVPAPVPTPVPPGLPVPAPLPQPVPQPGPAPMPAPLPVREEGLTANGTPGNDLMDGTSLNDRMDGRAGNDTLRGGAGDDGLKGGAGDDLLEGGAGNDRLPGEDGNDRVFGGDGNDMLGGGNGNDYMSGGDGVDRGGGGNGRDTILGGAGDDWFSGGPGEDHVDGGAGNDRLAGSYSNDTVLGGAGNDTMGGGEGKDRILAGAGNDVVGAGGHDDYVNGGSGDDFLGGGDGDDRIIGGRGNDTINPGYGNDIASGGPGRDLFVFNALSGGGQTVVTDFTPGMDELRLVGLRGLDHIGELEIAAISNRGAASTEIQYGDHSIILRGVAMSEIDNGDLLFS
ncbi:hypothetical protein [Palleronia rufa]|uniref:calcium-binding protein n=1 Tax=Palleronia rufa TaxID=1530186 RepID=UPI00068CFF3A